MVNAIRSGYREVVKKGVAKLPDSFVAYLAGQELVAPCYHMVSNEFPLHTRNLYGHRNKREFEQDLDYFLKYFKPLSLEDLSELVRSGLPLPPKSFFLSFDDGFREMGDVVAEVCRRKGVPATFFLTTGFLNNRLLGFRQKASVLIQVCLDRSISVDHPALKPLALAATGNRTPSADIARRFLALGYKQSHVLDACASLLEVDFDEYLQKERPYLTDDQVSQLVAAGFSIGGHSVDHPLYADLSPDEQVAQTSACMKTLASQMRPGARSFAFPFVSDGVKDEFFEQVFRDEVIDLAFCIGRMPKTARAKASRKVRVVIRRVHSHSAASE